MLDVRYAICKYIDAVRPLPNLCAMLHAPSQRGLLAKISVRNLRDRRERDGRYSQPLYGRARFCARSSSLVVGLIAPFVPRISLQPRVPAWSAGPLSRLFVAAKRYRKEARPSTHSKRSRYMYACISSHRQWSSPNFRPAAAISRARSSCPAAPRVEVAESGASVSGGPRKKERMSYRSE